MNISEQQFAAICYLVLMDHHGASFIEAHPTYITEKLHLLSMGYDAYGALNRENQERVKRYIIRWKYEIPAKIRDYEAQLEDAGIFS